jgi:hypothetical protein
MTIQEVILIMLRESYGAMKEEGKESVVNVFEIGKKHGISEKLCGLALSYLDEKNLLVASDSGGGIMLNANGIDAYELRSIPNTPLYQMNQYVINVGRDVSAGDIQQGSNNIIQKLTYEQIFQKLEEAITKSNLKDEQKKTLLTRLKEFTSHPLIVEFLKRLIFGQLQV